jgi:2',3'-cyclic-nucleotide 2'-phosphodiesterase (5'-nucleotidase family)
MGSDARNLGRIDINLVRSKLPRTLRSTRRVSRFRIQSIDFSPVPVTDSIKDDAEVAAIVARYENQLNASLSEVIGKTSEILDARAAVVRFRESNLGNFLADVYRQTLNSDVALVNGGSIRSDATYGKGDLTKKDILTILPFENTLVKVSLTGAHLKRLLEHGVSAAGEENGRFPQVSGMTFSYDASKPVGSRVMSIEIGGKPADFKGAKALVTPEEGPLEPDVVMEAIRKQGTISPQVEGRIKAARPTEGTSLLLFNLWSLRSTYIVK